jgi:hypothetical protein
MARMQISPESSTWLLQAKDFLDEARRLKPGPERNELRQTAKVLRELARREAASESALERDWRQSDRAVDPLSDGAFPEMP